MGHLQSQLVLNLPQNLSGRSLDHPLTQSGLPRGPESINKESQIRHELQVPSLTANENHQPVLLVDHRT